MYVCVCVCMCVSCACCYLANLPQIVVNSAMLAETPVAVQPVLFGSLAFIVNHLPFGHTY